MPLTFVATITRCRYGKRKLRANYVSLSSGMRERLLSPLAVVHDGLRWHIRCFDHEAGEYKDYNLARFHTADEEDQSDIRLEDDAAWNNEVRVELVPHPKATYPEAIRTDSDIDDCAKNVSLSS